MGLDIKGLARDWEVSTVIVERMMNLKVSHLQGHHNEGLRLWEHVLDFPTRFDVPFRYIVSLHGLDIAIAALSESDYAFPHPLHDGSALIEASVHEVNHDVTDRSAIPALTGHFPTIRRYCETDQSWKQSGKGGRMSLTMPRTKLVPNSGIPQHIVEVPISPGVTPKISVLEKRAMTPGSSIGISFGSMPDKSWAWWIIVGSSCPRTSSLRTFSSISWKLKWVFRHSAVTSSAGYCTGWSHRHPYS